MQHDAWDLGVTTSDNFGNADVDYAATLPAVRAALQQAPGAAPCVPIVTGFLGRGRNTGAPHPTCLPSQNFAHQYAALSWVCMSSLHVNRMVCRSCSMQNVDRVGFRHDRSPALFCGGRYGLRGDHYARQRRQRPHSDAHWRGAGGAGGAGLEGR